MATGKGTASTYIPTGCSAYAESKKLSKSIGKCATYVKQALTSTNAGKVNNNEYFGNVDACTMGHWYEYFGYHMVCQGTTKECPSNFTPQDGDLMVNAGCQKGKYGHVSIYNSKTNQWIADFGSSGPGCYSDASKRNNWVIYRK